MNYYLSLFFGLLIVIPATIGWVRFSKIDPAFLPFLIYIWTGTINEIYGAIAANFFNAYTIINVNINFLLESILLLWQFKLWHLFATSKKSYISLLVILIIIWTAETIFRTYLTNDFNSYFRIVYSSIVVLLSIGMLNKVLMRERSLYKSSIFFICFGFILMYTYSLLFASLAVYGMQWSNAFYRNLSYIFTYMNLCGNLIYAVAIWLMPRRQPFALQY